jgi:hypothetical protein
MRLAGALPRLMPSLSARQIRTSLSQDSDAAPCAAQRPRHSARAAARLALKIRSADGKRLL